MKTLKCFLFGAVVLGVCVLMHFYGEATEAREMQEEQESAEYWKGKEL